ncbi:trypsin-like peptidase domain-containing protein [Natroniella acetigena]|uniref:S1C family serine protease n=1 Tax=Natroniella acetigena TaxID=52004 RepID=UPI00200A969B|nr:trypsin-like peptidase domain-containing protein [Natroniella acetigena]MCK8827579.1 trypsin-like peptidase domain-containing protein [Natroniella acetigena]
MKRFKERIVGYSCLILIGVLIGSFLVTDIEATAFWSSEPEVEEEQQQVERIVVPQEEAVKKVVREVGPAVVSIITKDTEVRHDFFFNPIPEEREGIGSGVIIDQKGHILTNHHVVGGVDEIEVLLPDGRDFTAEVVGEDPRNDLAVIQVDASDLPVAPLGDSNQLEVGQLAIAIGSPFGVEFSNTVTTGVISALGREIRPTSRVTRSSVVLDGLIQTDASINPGNSGGPLLDSQGQVVGINTAIIGSAEGIGFAIPVNRAKEIIDDLIEYGRVRRPWLGIYGAGIAEQVAQYYGLDISNGVMILRTVSNSPASKAGLSRGDIIIEADHQEVKDMNDLQEIIVDKEIGEQLELLIMSQDGNLNSAKVTLGEMPIE